MKILIVENEIYLAQSIASKLGDIGHECEIATTIKEALKPHHWDVILLSTSLNDPNFYNLIEKFKNSIIILLISYITSDTVSKPIKAGADDYIQKPFMIDELVRKIKHFEEHKKLKIMNDTYKEFMNFHLGCNSFDYNKKLTLPFAIKTSKIKFADNFVFSMMQKLNQHFILIPLNSDGFMDKILNNIDSNILYLSNFQILKGIEKEKVLNLIHKKKVIISTTDLNDEFNIECITLQIEESSFEQNSILTIDDYIKFVIKNYQNTFSDTELSKRLGISRKSLWEKRKKYDISKRK